MKKLIFLDLDGTLWNNEKVPLSALSAILQAKKNGHKIFANTGRTYCEAITSLLPLQLTGHCFSAGSEIYVGDKTILFDPLPAHSVKKMTSYLLKHHVGVSMEGSHRVYQDPINHSCFAKTIAEDANNEALRRFMILEDISQATKEDYNQFMKIFLCNPNGVDISIIQKGVEPDSELTMFGLDSGEITNAKHNKGTAIQTLKQYFNNAYETVAFGDSENDLTMFDVADISVAMGNAKKEIQEKTDFVTTDISDNGLQYAFEKLGII